MGATKQHSLAETLRAWADIRLLKIFVFGIASGFPWVLIGSAMSAWLQESGLTRSAIGFFGSVFAVYAINFLWSPVVDALRLPFISRLGQRRSWILLTLTIILFATAAIGFTNPQHSLVFTSLLALLIATASATQDIAIDAFRIELIPADDDIGISHGSAATTAGWWTGYGLFGAIGFWAADVPTISWSGVYLILCIPLVLLIIWTLCINEPVTDRDQKLDNLTAKAAEKLGASIERNPINQSLLRVITSVTEAFKEFFTRCGIPLAISVLSFIFLFKLGEAFLGRMSVVFYKEVGFTNTEIGTYSKLIGWWVTIIFSFIAATLNARFGLIKGLFIGGIAMAASNLMFSWIAATGPDTNLFLATVVVDGFTSAFATVTFVAFISHFTSHTFTATQYALMASLANLGRTLLASSSGAVVDWLDGDWYIFFILTAVMVIPSLILLAFIAARLRRNETLQRT